MVVEVMKMENVIPASCAGQLPDVLAAARSSVKAGAELAMICAE